jgi:hypothetical protein
VRNSIYGIRISYTDEWEVESAGVKDLLLASILDW